MLNLESLVSRIVNSFTGFVNVGILAISKFAIMIMGILPDSPFQSSIDKVKGSDILMSLDWAIPFTSFVSIGVTWTTSIAVYYVVSVALRWVKAIE